MSLTQSMGFGRACMVCGAPVWGELCPACWAEDDSAFRKVKGYLKERPMATVAEVSAATGVEERRIARWIAKGWLVVYFPCAICGRPIREGEICQDCAAALIPEGPVKKEYGESARVRVLGMALC